jgi:hypothetical protein
MKKKLKVLRGSGARALKRPDYSRMRLDKQA